MKGFEESLPNPGMGCTLYGTDGGLKRKIPTSHSSFHLGMNEIKITDNHQGALIRKFEITARSHLPLRL